MSAAHKSVAIFLDANILFSGAHESSQLRRFLNWLMERERLVTSAYAVTEAERNILAKRQDWHGTFQSLVSYVGQVPEAPLLFEAGLPDKDKPILGAAISARCSHLLTGDKKDFGHLYGKAIQGVTIISVLDLAEFMMKKYSL
jgi:hypothetical protein